VTCYIATAWLLSPQALIEELDELERVGADVQPACGSRGLPLILPYHHRHRALSAHFKFAQRAAASGPPTKTKSRLDRHLLSGALCSEAQPLLDFHNFVLTKYLGAKPCRFLRRRGTTRLRSRRG